MFSTLRYPTKQQNLIWLRRRQKNRPSEIAKDLKMSRPYVSIEQKKAEDRIKNLMEHAASVNRVTIERMSARYGIAEGYCHATDSKTYITYSPKIGVLSWYEHVGDCGTCDIKDQCKETLQTLAEEWEIPAPPDMPPTELSEYLFDTIRGRLKWDQM
jgi:transcriptional regulator